MSHPPGAVRAGGRIGSGRQWMSWIALDDLLANHERAVDDDAMTGLYHLISPDPVRNTQMMATIRRATGRRFGLPSPAPLTRIGARPLGSDPTLALTGRRGTPARLQHEEGASPCPSKLCERALPRPFPGHRRLSRAVQGAASVRGSSPSSSRSRRVRSAPVPDTNSSVASRSNVTSACPVRGRRPA